MSQNMADNRRAGGGGGGSACICIRCFDDLFSYFLRFRGSPEEIEQRQKSRQIDKSLRREGIARRKQVVLQKKNNCFVYTSTTLHSHLTQK